MKRIPFYHEEPSIVRAISWLGYGLTPWLAPAVLPMAMINDGTVATATTVALYGTMTAAYAFPRTREYVVRLHRNFWLPFKHHLAARRMSRAIRETLRNSGLVVVEKREVTDKNGRTRLEEIIHYPDADIQLDDANIYIPFRMLAGQTEQEWERKINAFAHALECSLISSKIERGVVELTLQYAELSAPSVPYKADTTHSVTLGFSSAGPLVWDFDLHPHALIVGPTGTGKSTFMRNLLIQLSRDWTVKIADGKQVEFSALTDYGYDVAADVDGFVRQVEEAQNEVERRFQRMKESRVNHYADLDESPYFLIIDEAIYLIEALPAKKDRDTGVSERDRILGLIRDISLRGRAAGVYVVMIFQRPDSSVMPTLIRDNLTAKVVLGGSETTLEMCFGSEKVKVLDPVTLGHGYASISDGPVQLFRFPEYPQSKFLRDLEDRELDLPGTERGPRGILRFVGRPTKDESREPTPSQTVEINR